MKIALLRTPIVNLKNSPFGSTPGIPANLPCLASVLIREKHQVAIVDAYGIAPHRFMPYANFDPIPLNNYWKLHYAH